MNNKTCTLLRGRRTPAETPSSRLPRQHLPRGTNQNGSDLLAEELPLEKRLLSNVVQSTRCNFRLVPT